MSGLHTFGTQTGTILLSWLDDIQAYFLALTSAEKDIHTIYGTSTGYTDTTIQAAITAAGSNVALLALRPGTWVISDNLTIPSNITLKIVAGAYLQIASGKVVTFASPPQIGLYPVFTGTGTVAFATTLPELYPQWFGATLNDTLLSLALAAVSTNPVTLVLTPGTWAIANSLAIPATVHVKLMKGASLSVTTGKTLTISGAVTAGAFQIFAGAGTTVVSTYPQDAIWWGSAENLSVTSLTATGASITTGTVTTLSSTTGTITTLGSTTGNVTTLNSTTGNVTTLNSTTANIGTLTAGVIVGASAPMVTVRQTVMGAPVGTDGLPTFLATASGLTLVTQNVSSSAPFVATSANGFGVGGEVNTIGASTSNLTWDRLANTSTLYLYVTITNGVLSTGSTALAPYYQWGGTAPTTNSQATYNIQEAKMYMGNGATAPQANIVFVGEATTAGGNITAVVMYALNGRYDSGYTATLPSTGTVVSKNHNIGTSLVVPGFRIKCTSTELNYAVGDVVNNAWSDAGTAGYCTHIPSITSSKAIMIVTGTSAAFKVQDRTSGAVNNPTAAKWAYELYAKRDF